MENLVGGNDYCERAELLLFGGGFHGSNELYMILFNSWVNNCNGSNA
jgi:hypothetical protein